MLLNSNQSYKKARSFATNTKNVLLAVFIALTLVFASLTAFEYNEVGVLNARIGASQSKTTSSELSFPHDQSGIGQFCSSGQPVDGGWMTQTFNATGQVTRQDYFTPVMVMPDSSTAYACITYQSDTGSDLAGFLLNRVNPINFSFMAVVCSLQGNGLGLGCSHTNAGSGRAFPSSMTLTNTTSAFTVIYTITTTAASKGFYGGAGDVYWGHALAVGYQPSQVNASDFDLHIFAGGHSELNEPIHAVSVSVIDMNVTYLDFQCQGPELGCILGK